MSPILRELPVDDVLARLRASGDEAAAALVERMRDALAAQDDALRNLVADARELDETVDEGGSCVDIKCADGGFDALLSAHGYGPLSAFDRAEFERAGAGPGGAEMYDGQVHISPLDHLFARIGMEGEDPDSLTERGLTPVEVTRGGRKETLFVDRSPRQPRPSPPSP